MEREIQPLEINETWDVVELLARTRPIGCKWCTQSKESQMRVLTNTRQDWWQKVTAKYRALITLAVSLLWLKL
ncbi:hypothetical protein LIER_09103 [Lithospermum erythrorhizon]|uniref:Uncharacterized protein n=1 Tax=Lithospermum erythrorhizon TaxID=34254 RepID=A0AAV3PFR3_LITER